MKNIHFISGLPRSGSTLLANILAQNPKFNSTSTSGILDIMFGVRNNWNELIEFKASPNDDALLRVLKGILESYHNTDKVVFDKSRGWLSQIEMAEAVLGRKVKIIVPVRDIREVLASFEMLWRNNAPYRQLTQEKNDYFNWQTQQGRVKAWLDGSQPVGLAYNRIKDALHRGFGDRMLFVNFEDLTSNPKETMKVIYDFLEEEYYEHDFENVKQVTTENDEVHGMKGLHKIRNKVEPVKSKWKEVLGEWAEILKQHNFWNKD